MEPETRLITGSVLNKEASASVNTYEDYLIQMMMDMPSSGLDDSEVSEKSYSPELLQDTNSNYIQKNNGAETVSDSRNNTVENSLSSSSLSTDSIASALTSTSDNYPKSGDSSDCIPLLDKYDREKEIISRVKYYSDFTIDRQRKIAKMAKVQAAVNTFKQESLPTNHETSLPDVLTREVEGSECAIPSWKVNLKWSVCARNSASNTDNSSTITPVYSSPNGQDLTMGACRQPITIGSEMPSPKPDLLFTKAGTDKISPSETYSDTSYPDSISTWSQTTSSEVGNISSTLRNFKAFVHDVKLRCTSSPIQNFKSHSDSEVKTACGKSLSCNSDQTFCPYKQVSCSETVINISSTNNNSCQLSCRIQSEGTSINSSLEAKHGSSPDASCSTDSTDQSPPLGERLGCIGQSFSSESSNSASAKQESSVLSTLPTSTTDYGTGCCTKSSSSKSLNSVSSSGIYAPFNSPHTTDYSTGSKASNTTSSGMQRKRKIIPMKISPRYKVRKRFLCMMQRKRVSPKWQSSTPKEDSPESSCSDDSGACRTIPSTTSQSDYQLMDKKAVIKKFQKFKVQKQRKEGKFEIETLANL